MVETAITASFTDEQKEVLKEALRYFANRLNKTADNP